MHRTRKPVHKCHPCLLNLGDRCWAFDCPHDQWHNKSKCLGFENEELYAKFRDWQEEPRPQTPKERRREAQGERETEEHHNHFPRPASR